MQQKFLPVYFFPGSEIGRKRDHISAIKSSLTKQIGEEPELHRLYPYDTDMSSIVTLLQSGSLFSSRRLVILGDAHVLKAADIKILKGYLNTPSPNTVLVITTDENPGSREYPRSLANALPSDAVKIFWEMFERDKRGWVMGFLREKGLKADKAAIDLLLDITEGTTDALRETCELLAFSIRGTRVISTEDIDRILEHGREETVYSLFDRFCRRDLGGVLESYSKMTYSEPSSADRILSMLADPVARLRDFAILLNRGLSPENIAEELQIRGGKRAVHAYSEGARNFELAELAGAVKGIIDLEAWLRTAPREIRAAKTELWFCSVISHKSSFAASPLGESVGSGS